MRYNLRPSLSVLGLLLSLLVPSLLVIEAAHSKSAAAPDGAPVVDTRKQQSGDAATRVRQNYGTLPLSFEANRGQTDARVQFLARNSAYSVYLAADEIALALRDTSKQEGAQPRPGRDDARESGASVLRIKLLGASRRPRAQGLDELEGKSNYLLGRDPSRWRTNVPNYGKVKYEGVYPGVDVVYYGTLRQLEYDFNVAPGADAGRIRMRVEGAQGIRIDENGDLVMPTAAGEVRQRAPHAYQESGGGRETIACRYVLRGAGLVGFELGAYDKSLPLVIDPVIGYSTYLGGSGYDEGSSIVVDAQGNAYVTGFVTSWDFPVTPNAPQQQRGGGAPHRFTYDSFITKLNPDGTALVYSTYIGGSEDDFSGSIAVDGAGQAHVAGWTASADFPTTAGAHSNTRAGGQEIFVSKLDAAGSSLLYSTYLGGGGNEYGADIALGGGGEIYVGGMTASSDFPVTPGGFQPQPGSVTSNVQDGFVTKLSPLPWGGLLFSTYLGGADADFVEDIAVASNLDDSVYVTGRTISNNFPVTPGALQPAPAGGYDAFVTRLDSNGSALIFSTYLGGSDYDGVNSIAFDGGGNAYVAGYTYSLNFPTTPGVVQPAPRNNTHDAFVAKVKADGTGLHYATYFGGSGDQDRANDIAVDGAGNAYVAGESNSSDLAVTPGATGPSFGGGDYDGFFLKLGPAGNVLTHATYVGGNGWDGARGVAVAPNGDVYLTGVTSSTNFHTTPGAFQPQDPDDGATDAFVMRLVLDTDSFSVSGRVTNFQDSPLRDADVTVYAPINQTVRTDADGNYTINGLPPGSEVRLYATRFGAPLVPVDAVIPNISRNETIDFTGDPPLLISGRVLNEFGYGLMVPVTLSGTTGDTTYTNYDGTYSFIVPARGSYTVTPGPDYEFTFAPSGHTVSNIVADQTLDFVAQRPPRIEGRVVHNEYEGYGIGDIKVTLTGPSLQQPLVRTTDSWGYFSFDQLERGTSYTVTPSDPVTNRSFAPAEQFIPNLQGGPQPFITFRALQPLAIHGRVTDPNGNPVTGTATLTGTVNAQTEVDQWGHYDFFNLPRGGDYTVTVTKPGTLYTFSPPSRGVTNLQEFQAFDFTALPPLNIRGRVAETGDYGSNGVRAAVTLTGTVNATTQADEWGFFEFAELPRGGNYTVEVAYTHYTFDPPSRKVSDAQADQFFEFTALPPLRIMGHISDPTTNSGVSATVTLSGTVNATTQSDEWGNFMFQQLPRGGSYTVTVTKPGTLYTFTPASRSVSNLQANEGLAFEALPPLSIFGTLFDGNGGGVGGATVTLSGAANATTVTDEYGNYTFLELPRGGDYTVTPAHDLYTFTPSSAALPAMNANQVVTFQSAPRRFTLTGRVADAAGAPLPGVTLTLGGSSNATTQTNTAGNYSFADLVVARPYTVAAARPGFNFAPASVSIQDPRGDQQAGFTATRLTYTISGRVTDKEDGSPVANATMTLGGGRSETAQTDEQGNYAFTGLPSEGDYSVHVSHPHFYYGYPTITYFNLLSDQTTVNWAGTRLSHQISGHVTDAAGNPLPGVTVTLGGAQSAATQTDGFGLYIFAGLPAGLDYTVTAAKTHYTFSPPTRQFDDLIGNTTADFAAALLAHNISGRVVDSNGNGFAGATVSLTGTRTGAVTTDATGNYSFTSLPAGGNYTVEVSRQFYDFSPMRGIFNDLGGDQSLNFTATLRTFSVGGRVAEGTNGVAGVTVNLGGSRTATTQTDAAGNYLFTQLPANGSYTVTPAHPFFAFSPGSTAINTLPSNQTANFAAARLLYQVSGSALDACGRAIPGVSMSLSHDGVTTTAQTNASGLYTFNGVQAGYNYTLAPTGSTYTFNPSSVSLPALGANQSRNFTGTPPTSTADSLALADLYVRGGSATSNFGTATQLIVRQASQTKDTYETYLKFDAGQRCTVASVKLRLYGQLSSTTTMSVAVYAVPSTTWTETGTTWNNKPAAGALLRTVSMSGTTARWYEWDVTDYVRAEQSAGRTVVSFVLKSTSTTNYQATFNSRQAAGSNAPRLTITTP